MTNRVFFVLLLACVLFAVPIPINALSTHGEWTATTITTSETVNLTDDVTVKGTITINSGCKLTINNDPGRTLRSTPKAKMDSLFMVHS